MQALWWKIVFAFLFLLCSCQFGKGQLRRWPLAWSLSETHEKKRSRTDPSFHSAIKPYHKEAPYPDTGLPKEYGLSFLYNDSLSGDLWLTAMPLLDSEMNAGRYHDGESSFKGGVGGGMAFYVDAFEKVTLGGSIFSRYRDHPSYLDGFIEGSGVMPGMGKTRFSGAGHSSTVVRGYGALDAGKWIDIVAGKGKFFFGDGYRSLFLSDNAAPYPYLGLTANVRGLQYQVVYAGFRGHLEKKGPHAAFADKYGAFHLLDWKMNDWLSLGFFESVIWRGRDTLIQRGFDVNYLNPVIFMRPVEYAQGSSDNSLMGLNLKLSPGRGVHFYGQFLLDEFLLKEIRAGNGWWANKYGVQAGIKMFDPFGLEGLHVRGEVNLVRPFTYSHGNVLQNYGHASQSLAHPWGANFREGVLRVRYKKGRWALLNHTVHGRRGRDPSPTISFGGDPYKSYNRRNKDYGHVIAQGVEETLTMNRTRLSYIIDPHTGLRLEGGVVWRVLRSSARHSRTRFAFLSLRTAFANQYLDR